MNCTKNSMVIMCVCWFFALPFFANEEVGANKAKEEQKIYKLSDFFNTNLTYEKYSALQRGEEVFSRLSSVEDLCLEPINFTAQSIIKNNKELDPSYLMEIIKVLPVGATRDISTELVDELLNIEQYNDIPYFSESHQRWEKLFSDAEIVEKDLSDTEGTVKIRMKMDPFGKFDATIIFKKYKDMLVFELSNPKVLRIIGLPAVDPQKMLCCMYAVKNGDSWILYGIGGISAPSVPFFGAKAEVSFVNRISTFCRYMFEEIEQKN